APPVRTRRVPGPSAIVKDFAALLEHIHEDESESHSSGSSRTTRSASIPTFIQRADSTIVSLPPPPRPRNRALVRPAPHPFANPSVAVNSNPSRPRTAPIQRHPFNTTPTLAPAPHTRNFSARAGSIPLSPAAVPLPASSTSNRFPQTPRSSFFCTPQTSGPPSPKSPACRSTFLPSCKSTIESATVKDVRSTRTDSIDLAFRASTYSDFNLPWCSYDQRASGISFASTTASATEAESIPIGLFDQPTPIDYIGLAPLSPTSSLLREAGVQVDVLLPSPEEECEDGTDESFTTEDGSKHDHKSSVKESFRERARSLSAALPTLNVSSLSKVDRVLGNGAARALLSGVHVPHLSLSSSSMSSDSNVQPSAPLFARSDSADQSFLPQTQTGPHSFIGLGRKLSKKAAAAAPVEPNMARRRSEDVGRVPSGGLMARMGGFIGRTPSPTAKSEEFGEDDNNLASPTVAVASAAPLRLAGRRHSVSDVLVISAEQSDEGATVGRVPPQNRGQIKRGFHRPTASASSALPLLPPVVPVSPAFMSPDSFGLLSPEFSSAQTTSSVGEDVGLVSSKEVVEVEKKSEDGEEDECEGEEDRFEEGEGEDDMAQARRAKRAKVAKLNRYLGSRVPAHLVLGLDETWDPEQDLPEVKPGSEDRTGSQSLLALGGGRKKSRRSSEGEEEEDIGDVSVMSSEEKARAVRRKAKMEKMFGERPPQKLYQPQSGADTSSTTLENLTEESEEYEEWEQEGGGEHYKSYRASFNSLAYFVNNADRDSLEGLYNIVSSLPEDESSEGGAGGQKSQFAARRKRAAKLSKFFGVSYRDLFGAVLDILESDVREDKEEGSLSAAETQDLLMKLRKLKAKGEDINV
ncbi:hypothetical protein FRC07_008326, partial [Ceratobasidium sp. 392]